MRLESVLTTGAGRRGWASSYIARRRSRGRRPSSCDVGATDTSIVITPVDSRHVSSLQGRQALLTGSRLGNLSADRRRADHLSQLGPDERAGLTFNGSQQMALKREHGRIVGECLLKGMNTLGHNKIDKLRIRALRGGCDSRHDWRAHMRDLVCGDRWEALWDERMREARP